MPLKPASAVQKSISKRKTSTEAAESIRVSEEGTCIGVAGGRISTIKAANTANTRAKMTKRMRLWTSTKRRSG